MSVDLAYLHNRKFAVIMIEEDGTEDGDRVVLGSTAKWRDGELWVERGGEAPDFPVPDTAWDRV